MLPDFIELKRRIESKLTATMQRRVASEGMLSLVSHQRLYEGHGFVLHRADGTVQDSEFQRHVAEMEVPREDLINKGFDSIKAIMDSTVEQFAQSGHKMMIEGLNQAVGNRAIEAAGRPFTAELYLDGLETIEFSFDESGDWDPPTLIIHPDLIRTVQGQLERLNTEETLRQRLSALIERKKAEWRDREARRKLVD